MKIASNIIQASIFFIINIIISILFISYSGINYNPAGVSGKVTPDNLLFSILFCVLLISTCIIAGYLRKKGILWGVVFTPIVVFVLPFFGVRLMGTIMAILMFSIFYFIAPFTPIIEGINELLISKKGYYIGTVLMTSIPYLLNFPSLKAGLNIDKLIPSSA